MALDEAAAKAAGYSDEEIAAYKAAKGNQSAASTASGGNIAAPGSAYDPSAGGGNLEIYNPLGDNFNTHIRTPEWLDRLMSGTGRGMVHTVNAVGNLAGAVPDSTLKNEADIDKPVLSTGAGKVGNFLGETAITAPLGMGSGALAAKAAPILAGAIPQAAIQGATQGVATSDPGDRLLNGGIGAVAGGAIPVVSGTVSRLVNGLKRSDAAQRLLNAGIDKMTPGQMNPGGAFNQFEQSAESVPGAKQIIEPARDAAEHQFQAHIIQQGAAPGAPKIAPSASIHDMLNQAYDSYAPLYAQAHGYPVVPKILNTTGPDVPLSQAFAAAAKAPGVPKSLQRSEDNWLQDRLTQLPKNPDSEHLLDLRSDIRARARNANLKTDTDSGHIANINSRAEKQVTAALSSQLPPGPLQALQTADSNYGNYKIIENAVAKSKDNLAGLTPQKLSQSIFEATADPQYARGGGGPLRQLAKDGSEVFQNVSPPTGARLASIGGAAGLAAAAPAHISVPILGGAMGMIATPTGRAIAQGATRPQKLAQMLAAKANTFLPPSNARSAGTDLLKSGATLAAAPYVPATAQAIAAALTHRPFESKEKQEEAARR